MKKYVLALLCMLTACGNLQQMETGLTRLQGQNIAAAFPYLGYPDSKVEVQDKVVYHWSTVHTETYDTPYGGFASGAYGGGFAGYGYRTQSVALYCKVSLITKNDIIIASQYDGDVAGCRRYNEAFPPVSKTP